MKSQIINNIMVKILTGLCFLVLMCKPIDSLAAYNTTDSTILRALDLSCDKNDSLNWNTEPNPGKWTGVTWNGSGRVTNLYLENLRLTGAMNVSGLSELTLLHCSYNQLTSLNVTGLINLKFLYCYNNQLTSLNVAGLANLLYLWCSSNQLTSLNVSSLTNLGTLRCNDNKLTSLNVSGLTNLQIFHCYSNQLASLNVNGLINLTNLDCYSNLLTYLDVSGLTSMQLLKCYSNKLTSLNVSGLSNLQTFWCYSNQLTSLEVSGLSNLQTLDCNSNFLTSLDASGLSNLTTLYCHLNPLSRLNVSGLTKLTSLYCYYNLLTKLNVSDLVNLTSLFCYFNQLTSLDVSNLTKLKDLRCSANQLTSLDISKLISLSLLQCNNNPINNLDASLLANSASLECRNNKLPFNLLATGLHLSSFSYNPQDTIFTPQQLTYNVTLNYMAQALIDGTTTNFEFYKDGVLALANTTGIFTTTGTGEYHCKMTNAKFPGLTLTTAKINIHVPSFLTVSATNISFNENENSTTTFTINSNTSWTVTSSQPWLTVNPESGSNDGTITIHMMANATPIERYATIIISAAAAAACDIKVDQAGKPIHSSVNVLNSGDISIYHSPVTDMVRVTLLPEHLPAKIEIYNLEGKQIKFITAVSFVTTIDMNGLKSGIYLITVVTPSQTVIKKIVKS